MNPFEFSDLLSGLPDEMLTHAVSYRRRKSPAVLRIFAGLTAAAAACTGIWAGMRWLEKQKYINRVPDSAYSGLDSEVEPGTCRTDETAQTTSQTAQHSSLTKTTAAESTTLPDGQTATQTTADIRITSFTTLAETAPNTDTAPTGQTELTRTTAAQTGTSVTDISAMMTESVETQPPSSAGSQTGSDKCWQEVYDAFSDGAQTVAVFIMYWPRSAKEIEAWAAIEADEYALHLMDDASYSDDEIVQMRDEYYTKIYEEAYSNRYTVRGNEILALAGISAEEAVCDRENCGIACSVTQEQVNVIANLDYLRRIMLKSSWDKQKKLYSGDTAITDPDVMREMLTAFIAENSLDAALSAMRNTPDTSRL